MTATLAGMDSKTLTTFPKYKCDITNVEDSAIRNVLPYGGISCIDNSMTFALQLLVTVTCI